MLNGPQFDRCLTNLAKVKFDQILVWPVLGTIVQHEIPLPHLDRFII